MDPVTLGMAKADAKKKYGTQVVPGLHVTNPKGLRRWHAALADARLGLARITCLGDSITYGVGSDGLPNGETPAVFRTSGWVPQLREMFARQYDHPGEGFLYRFDGSWSTTTGATTHDSSAPYGGGMRANPGQSIQVAVPRGTTVNFWTWDGGTGTCSYTVDGGAAVEFSAGPNNNALVSWAKHTISGLTDGPHTVVFNGPASGTLYLSGVEAALGSTGVQVNRMGRSGWTTANLVGMDSGTQSSTAGQQRRKEGIYKVTGADLYVIALGSNDYSRQNTLAATDTIPGTIPSQYKANLQEMVNMFAAQGKCTLLVGEPRTPNAPAPETYTLDQYWTAMRQIAESTDHCAFVDVAEVWGTAAQAFSLGFHPDGTTVHPSRRGHGSIAQIVHRVLTAPAGVGA